MGALCLLTGQHVDLTGKRCYDIITFSEKNTMKQTKNIVFTFVLMYMYTCTSKKYMHMYLCMYILHVLCTCTYCTRFILKIVVDYSENDVVYSEIDVDYSKIDHDVNNSEIDEVIYTEQKCDLFFVVKHLGLL